MIDFIEEDYNYRAPKQNELQHGDIYFEREFRYYENMEQTIKKLIWVKKQFNVTDYASMYNLNNNIKNKLYINNIKIAKISDINLIEMLNFKPEIIKGFMYYIYSDFNYKVSLQIKNHNSMGKHDDEYSIMDLNTNKLLFDGKLYSMNDLVRILKLLNFKKLNHDPKR